MNRRQFFEALALGVPVVRALAAILSPRKGVATRGTGDAFEHVLPPRARYITRHDRHWAAAMVEKHSRGEMTMSPEGEITETAVRRARQLLEVHGGLKRPNRA